MMHYENSRVCLKKKLSQLFFSLQSFTFECYLISCTKEPSLGSYGIACYDLDIEMSSEIGLKC